MQKIYSLRSRLEKVAWDIIQDFNMKPRLMDGNGNVILVADSIPTACKSMKYSSRWDLRRVQRQRIMLIAVRLDHAQN